MGKAAFRLPSEEKCSTEFVKTPIGQFCRTWTISTVGSKCEICNTLRKPLSEEQRETMKGEYPYYGPTGVLDYIEEYRVDGTYALIGEDGDHFLKFREKPMTLLASGKFNVNNHAHLLKGTKEITTEWIFRFFENKDLKPFLTRQGAGRYKLSKNSLERVPIAYPSLGEQEKITEILACWDKAIELIRKLKEQKMSLKRGLMQRLLTGKQRLRGFCKDWKEIPIGNFLKETERYVDWNDDHLYRLVSVRRRSGGMFSRESLRGEQIKTKTLKATREGDFVIARMQVVHGAMAMTPSEFDGYSVSDSYVTCISADESRYYIPFFNYLSQLPKMYHLTLLSSHGVSIEKMTFDFNAFLKHKVAIPNDIAEQKQIVVVLDSINGEISKLTAIDLLLKEQKRGLMQQLLTGKKRVKV